MSTALEAGPRLVHTRAEVREQVAVWRAAGERVALVPTMGYLHEGHMSLVDRAREMADRVAMSVFVNPLQFAPSDDLDRYPRDLDRDLAMAGARGVDLVFAPDPREMYPRGTPQVLVEPGPLAARMEGAIRPGHFRGVLTVVAKLFGLFRPDVAVFGQKDYQQAALIRRMSVDLDMGVWVEVAPIIRDPDGLAMSSRNVYLSPDERGLALALSRGLRRGRDLFAAGERDAGALRAALRGALGTAGVQAEYAEAVDPDTLEPVAAAAPGTVLLVAARVGSTRLIDNEVLPG
ncbi:pantoate--beta-alanine ligase [Longimicrobium sp.]|jgi:pantoate--beta-alanine ligase|uniref:pantoate--beta-alanine ligase n=1 Tax=Longimicrobium sp. TaxID=2029185 RepID=UPI002ED895F5